MSEQVTSEQPIVSEDLLEQGTRWLAEGRQVALATVISTWGSSPRPTGSHLVVDNNGRFLGSVSGGCVEGAVITEAMDVMATGQATTMEFGVSNEDAWEVGLACGGRIMVYIEPLGLDSCPDPDPH